jgi:hypothetical protein
MAKGYLLLYIAKIGYLFGIVFNSFEFLNLLNVNRWIFLLFQPIMLSIIFVFFNYLIVLSFNKTIDYKNTNYYLISCNDKNVTEKFIGFTTNIVQCKYAHKYNCTNKNSQKRSNY